MTASDEPHLQRALDIWLTGNQTPSIRRRAPDFWRPASEGSGAAWSLSSILEPFGASPKPKLNIVTNLENASALNADGSSYVEAPHGRLGGAWMTCVDDVYGLNVTDFGENLSGAPPSKIDQLLIG